MDEETASGDASEWWELLAGPKRLSLPVRAWWVDCYLPKLEGGIDRWVDGLNGTDDERYLVRTAAHATLSEATALPSRRIVRSLAHALKGGDHLEEQLADEVVLNESRAWPSGCDAFDERLDGVRGYTTIGGHSGVGKSFFSLAAAIEQAKLGHFVVYVNTELPRSVMYERIKGYVGDPEDALAIAPYLKICNVGAGITREMLLDWIREKIDEDEVSLDITRMCIVIDSVNRIAALSEDSGGGFFRELKAWSNWARVATKDQPSLCWLEVHELSRSGEEKGAHAAYAADISLRLTKTEVPNCVNFEVAKARYGGEGVIGRMFLDHLRGKFVRPQ